MKKKKAIALIHLREAISSIILAKSIIDDETAIFDLNMALDSASRAHGILYEQAVSEEVGETGAIPDEMRILGLKQH